MGAASRSRRKPGREGEAELASRRLGHDKVAALSSSSLSTTAGRKFSARLASTEVGPRSIRGRVNRSLAAGEAKPPSRRPAPGSHCRAYSPLCSRRSCARRPRDRRRPRRDPRLESGPNPPEPDPKPRGKPLPPAGTRAERRVLQDHRSYVGCRAPNARAAARDAFAIGPGLARGALLIAETPAHRRVVTALKGGHPSRQARLPCPLRERCGRGRLLHLDVVDPPRGRRRQLRVRVLSSALEAQPSLAHELRALPDWALTSAAFAAVRR